VLDGSTGAAIDVEFTTERREIVDYSVVLVVEHEGELRGVRLYDGSHGVNELHRYTLRGGKGPAEIFHRGSLGDGMRDAIRQIRATYEAMVQSWLSS
jgi:hypothetical protein